jgi:lipopolysaccharide/colanic/teichoic acid biosynthesis glycosyltransferase
LISPTDSASIGNLVRPDTGPGVGKLAVKRAADAAIAALGLVILAPVLALLAIVIWLTVGSPAIFKTRRFGRGGRPFTMYKFRTMAVESAAATELFRNVAVGMVKIVDDPRVTPIGGLLRRFSLDELPQLWNVVRGDMSLVGPRPHDVGEVSLGDEATRRRLTVRPGLTGLWQVRARTNPSLEVRVQYDLEYISRWSLLLDLAIAWETIPVLLRGEGGQVASLELDRA